MKLEREINPSQDIPLPLLIGPFIMYQSAVQVYETVKLQVRMIDRDLVNTITVSFEYWPI